MAKDSHKKSILVEHKSRDDGKQPRFNKSTFDKALDGTAYKAYIEKAMRCPCSVKGSGNPLSSCENCGGTGYLFVDKTSSNVLIQSINRPTKFRNWSESDRGTINITTKGDVDGLAWMDRIKILDVVSIFAEITRIRKSKNGNLFSFLFYQPLSISNIYLFDTDKKPLIPLIEITHYTIDENKLKFTNTVKTLTKNDELTISLRYHHNPTYNVIDIIREIVKKKVSDRPLDCDFDPNELKKLPINAVARKTHQMFDPPDFDGESLFDNTVYA